MTDSIQRRARRLVVAPIERRIDHRRFRHSPGIVAEVAVEIAASDPDHIAEHFVGPVDRAGDRLGIRIEQELRAVEAHAALRIVRAVNAIAVKLPGPHVRQKQMPDLVGVLGHRDADVLLRRLGAIEQAKIHRRRILREDREVHAVAHPRGAKRIRITEPNFYRSHASRSYPTGGFGWQSGTRPVHRWDARTMLKRAFG